MLFTKVGVYKAEADGAFIVELGNAAEENGQPIHTSSPLAREEVRYLLRHVEMSDAEIERFLMAAGVHRTHASHPKASVTAR